MQIFIKTTTNSAESFQYKKIICLRDARSYILRYKLHATELVLDKYFKDNYGLSLKAICKSLVRQCVIQSDFDENLIVMWPDKELDLIASFITYGNRQIKGSDILRRAFK